MKVTAQHNMVKNLEFLAGTIGLIPILPHRII